MKALQAKTIVQNLKRTYLDNDSISNREQPGGLMKMKPEYDGKSVCFEFCGIKLKIENTGKGVWRLRSEKNTVFDDMGACQTLARDLGEEYEKPPLPVVYEENPESRSFCIKSADGSYVNFDGKIVFCSSEGIPIRTVTDIKAGDDSVIISLSAFRDERFYGTGERFDKVNQRGKKVHIYAIDRWCQTRGNSYIPIPFLLSSRQNALLMNRYEHSVFDICKSEKETVIIEQKYAPIDLYIFTGNSIVDIFDAYCSLSGFAPMPPEWAFGTLVCRYHPEFSTKEGVFNMTAAMEENGFPWSAVIIEGFRPYKKEKLPELKEICDRVHSLGKKVMIYEQCGRFPDNSAELFGLDDSYAVSSDNGALIDESDSFNLVDNFKRKKMRCIDLTSERSLEKWNEFWDLYINDMGIDGAKIDFCEQFPDKPSIKFSDGRDPMAAHHWYPTLYNIIQYRHFNTKPDGGVNYSRGGSIGAQRYPFVWAGDQRREFFFLKVVIKAALSLGLSGVPFVSWDMAGYKPSFNFHDKRHEADVFIRGLEFTAFSANIQTHGSVKRPYDFDTHTRDIYRVYSCIHETLRPYIVEQSRISCETGLPLMRHLFLHDAEDTKTYDIEDEYMLGSCLLAAPVLNRRKKRDIYLPKGEWVNIFTGREYKGKTVLKNYRARLEEIPVFRLKNAESQCLDEALEKAEPLFSEVRKLADKHG